ncbi:hypothetical protein [Endozoicomonas sp.]|uniref:hypothetical protein n=1 Tax=Endozoicomonas sp. TaxID=1892382 RepID=UPI002886478E|nr:hypothetical protein [Endozoicomonas sp.]
MTMSTTTYNQIRGYLSSGHYQIDQSNRKPYMTVNEELFTRSKKVVCIIDGRIQVQTTNLNNISIAQNTYGMLQAHFQCSQSRTVATASTFSEPYLLTRTRAPVQDFQRVSGQKSYRPQPTPNTELSEAQLKILHTYFIESKAYFNDDIKALTPLYGSGCFEPKKDGGFTFSAIQAPLNGYQTIKKQYNTWIQNKTAQEPLTNKPFNNTKDTSYASDRQNRTKNRTKVRMFQPLLETGTHHISAPQNTPVLSQTMAWSNSPSTFTQSKSYKERSKQNTPTTNTAQPSHAPFNSCTLQTNTEEASATYPHHNKRAIFSSTTSEAPLTKEHCQYLKTLIENKDDRAFFNDKIKAITSYDEQMYHIPSSDGKFTISLTRAQLPNYETIKKNFLNWYKTSPASSRMSPVNAIPAETCRRKLPINQPQNDPIQRSHINTTGSFAQPYNFTKKNPGPTVKHTLTKPIRPQGQPASEIPKKIQEFLVKINTEIDKIEIPDSPMLNREANLDRKEKLRAELKHKFALYREQFNNQKTHKTTQDLQEDFAKLKEMQRSMYFAVLSPQAKPMDLVLRGIKNRGYDCRPNAQNQYEIHNQYYLFFVTAYQLIGETALNLTEKPTSTFSANKQYQKECQSIKKEISSLETQMENLKSDNVKKKMIIEKYKNYPHLEDYQRAKQGIDLNEINIKTIDLKLETKKSLIKRKESHEVEDLRSKELEKAKKWSEFYKHQLSRENKNIRDLPEPFGNKINRGNNFPEYLFNVPALLHFNYIYIPKNDIQNVLRQPWTAINIDMNGTHLKTLVKQQDGSIADISDQTVTERKYKNVDDVIKYCTVPGCKWGLRHRPY